MKGWKLSSTEGIPMWVSIEPFDELSANPARWPPAVPLDREIGAAPIWPPFQRSVIARAASLAPTQPPEQPPTTEGEM